MTTEVLERIENQERKEVKAIPVLGIDNDFKDLLNPLSEVEFSLLESSIVNDKRCREPIAVWNGVIVDGHNRYQICSDNNIAFSVVEMNFNSKEEAILWALNANFGRRHLSNAAKCKTVMKVFPYYKDKAIAKQKGEDGDACNVTAELAKLANVSIDTMSKFINIHNSTDSKAQEYLDQLLKGKISINKAYRALNPKEEKRVSSRKGEFSLKDITVSTHTKLEKLISTKKKLNEFLIQVEILIKTVEEKEKTAKTN